MLKRSLRYFGSIEILYIFFGILILNDIYSGTLFYYFLYINFHTVNSIVPNLLDIILYEFILRCLLHQYEQKMCDIDTHL